MNIKHIYLLLGMTITPLANAANDLLPPNAKPGECYARVLVPPSYVTTEKQIVKKQETETIELIPAKYEWVEEKVMVKEETEVLNIVPATYKTVEETITVKPASKELVTVPAKYRTEEEKILVRAAYTTWKKGRGLIEKIDGATGELMCLVEVPAEYKTVKKQVIAEAPTTTVVEVPAKFQTIKKRVVDEAARVEKRKIPAEYKTVKVRKLVEEAKEVRTKVPAQYLTVSETAKQGEAVLEWRSVLCETNTTADLVQRIQRALANAGHYNGPIDGVIGSATRTGLTSYQDANGLARGQFTTETLGKLGVSL